MHVILTNQRLYNMHQHMHLEQAKLKDQPETYAIMDLCLAASKLNHVAYLRYKSRQARSPEYMIQHHVCEDTNKVIMHVNQKSTRMHHHVFSLAMSC